MNNLNDALVARLMEHMGERFDGIPEFSADTTSWEIISALRHRLPAHEQEIIAMAESHGG